MKDDRRATIYIRLDTLEENYRTFRSALPSNVRMLCVVKADAYGHGALPVARKCVALGADYLGIATIEEGLELRRGGVPVPVLLLGGVMPWDDMGVITANRLTPVVGGFEMLRKVALETGGGQSIGIHVKVDTGMGRLGFHPGEAEDLGRALAAWGHVRVEGLMTHFASSERRDACGAGQISTFRDFAHTLERYGVRPPIRHMANSGAICNYPEAYFDMVRLGIMLYGSYPDTDIRDRVEVRQVMNVVSKVAVVREFPRGTPLSYGGTFITARKTRIAYVPVGYGDGYPRSASNRGAVILRGGRRPIVGRICMDWLLVDATDCGEVRIGDEVVLLGSCPDGLTITADEIAEAAGTIPYEVLCNFSRRIGRVYV